MSRTNEPTVAEVRSHFSRQRIALNNRVATTKADNRLSIDEKLAAIERIDAERRTLKAREAQAIRTAEHAASAPSPSRLNQLRRLAGMTPRTAA